MESCRTKFLTGLWLRVVCKSWPPLQYVCVCVCVCVCVYQCARRELRFSSEPVPRCGICRNSACLPVTYTVVQTQQLGTRTNMYNARGRLQLMHLRCCQAGQKTLSDLSSPRIRHVAGQSVAHVYLPDSPFRPNMYHFSPRLQRGVHLCVTEATTVPVQRFCLQILTFIEQV